jgi:uncharacterized delta-60 repeat protein
VAAAAGAAAKINPCTLPAPQPAISQFIAGPPGIPGFLDSGFGAGLGKTIGFRKLQIDAIATQILLDGPRILVAGDASDECAGETASVWKLVRYHPGGVIDTAFGSGGVVKRTFGTKSGWVSALVIDQQGRILVAGSAQQQVKTASTEIAAVARYNADGTPDLSFGSAGYLALPDQKYVGFAKGIAVDSQGRILVAATSGWVMRIIRLTPTGAFDKTFNGTGQYLYTSYRSDGLAVTTQWIDQEERIVVAGRRQSGTSWQAMLWRFDSGGQPDMTFGEDGIVAASYHQNSDAYSQLTVDPGNRLLVGGETDIRHLDGSTTYHWLLARFLPDGRADTTLGGVGWLTSESQNQGNEGFGGFALQSDGRIVVAGSMRDPGSVVSGLTVWRFMPEGGLDPSFGPDGHGVVTDAVVAGGSAWADAAMLWGDDGVIVAGQVSIDAYTSSSGSTVRVSYPALLRFWR